MTHEIHVVARSADVVDEGKLIAGLVAARWQAPPDQAGLAYASLDTGVRASIEPVTAASLPAGYRALDLGLVLSYVRPTWFATETIPGFAAAVASAGALILDPQAESAPVPPDADALVASWVVGNESAVRAARATGMSLPWLDPASSLAWWRHQHRLPQLKVAFAAELYVPSIRLVRRAGSDKVERAMSWPDYVPTLMPDCDLIVILRSDPNTRFSIAGVAAAADVRESLSGLAEPIVVEESRARSTVVIRPGQEPAVGRRMASVKLEPFEGFEAVASDSFVDIPPLDAAKSRPGR